MSLHLGKWLGPMALALVLATSGGFAVAAEQAPDPDVVRLQAQLDVLDADMRATQFAGVERLQARQALSRLEATKPKARERPLRLWVAERRLEIAKAAARAATLQAEVAQLDRDRDRILLDASRRDADLARQEAERLRLQNLARTEEALRAQSQSEESAAQALAALAEAEQSRLLADAREREAHLARQEADLASAAADSLRLQLDSITSRRDERGEVMTLSGDVFAPGQARLRAEARANLARVVAFVQGSPGLMVRIEGHTDSRGSSNLNQALSQRRADAVREALIEDGVSSERLSAVGMGEDQPIADNTSEQGRARNRRVDVVLVGPGT